MTAFSRLLRRLTGAAPNKSTAAPAASEPNSPIGQENPSMTTPTHSISSADFVHGTAVLRMLEQMRGVGHGAQTKASFTRSTKILAQACRIYLTLESSMMDDPNRPKGFRCNELLEDFLKKVKTVLLNSGFTTADEDLPGPHGFRRALREYERARAKAAQSLEFIINIH